LLGCPCGRQEEKRIMRESIAILAVTLWTSFLILSPCGLKAQDRVSDQTVRIVRDAAQDYFQQAESFKQQKAYKQAIDSYKRAIAIDPEYTIALNNLGEVYLRLGDNRNAVRFLSEAINSNQAYALAFFNRGLANRRLGNFKQAVYDFNRTIDLKPDLIGAYIERGTARLDQGDLQGAFNDFNLAIQKDPDNQKSYNRRGLAWLNIKEYKKAIADFSKAIQLSPSYAWAYNNRGLAYYYSGQFKLSMEEFDKALAIRPLPAAFLNRANSKRKLKQFDQAIEDYQNALRLNANYAEALNNLAWLLATCPTERYRNGPEAIVLAQKAVAIDPQARYLNTLAAAYAESADFSRAIFTQKDAIDKLKQEGRPEELPRYYDNLQVFESGRAWREY
jgi:tetratricopeptide (TPR) repeat protein